MRLESWTSRARDALRRLRRSRPAGRRGVSAVEFALILPFLVVLLSGAFDLGNAFQQNIRLEAAARAGAQAAFSNSAPENMGRVSCDRVAAPPAKPANVAELVCQNLSGLNNATAVAQIDRCRCDDGTEGTCNFGVTSTCATPKVVSITVTRPFTTVGPLTQVFLPNLTSVKGNVEIRLL